MATIEENLTNLRLGSESALSFFMDMYSHNLHFFAYKLVRDKDTIPDVISESFFKLWAHRTYFIIIEELKSFLDAVVRNSCLVQSKKGRELLAHVQREQAVL